MRLNLIPAAICLFIATLSQAQNVGVGTNTPAAKLEVKSTNSGVLIPRLALTGSNDASTVPSPTNSTLIFNTATVTGAHAITPGYYWWNSSLSVWTKILDNASTPGDTNIYNTDGTLTGNRTMTMAGDTLNLNGGTLSTNQDALLHGLTVGLGSASSPSNTAMGAGVLKSNTGGINNTATGYDALTSNTMGGRNTATGANALYSNTSGGSNTASGYNALYSNISGNSNTANGTSALNANTTGSSNTATGSTALTSNTTGSYNTATGINALFRNTTGSNNSANGVYTMQNNSSGGNNTASGNSALFANTSGVGNTANGNLALFNDTTGGHNVAIGDSAGIGNVTGNANTYIGYDANASSATLSNATAIGANAYVGASNSMVLGAINGVNGASASVNVGIGTSTPAYTLQVAGTTSTTNLQMTNGANTNYLLQSDVSGNASWVNPNTIAAENIYNTNGSLTGNRTVTMGADNLTLSSTSGNLTYSTTSGGNVSIGYNNTSTGLNSIALGYAARSTGYGSIAMGGGTTANYFYSTAMGYNTTASADYSLAAGYSSYASGAISTAIGQGTSASGFAATSMGSNTNASGLGSTAIGNYSVASGFFSTAIGYGTLASGATSIALGDTTTAASYDELVLGAYNTSYTPTSTTSWSLTDRLFGVGNGTGTGTRSDAMVILKNGDVGLGTSTPVNTLQVEGTQHMDGNPIYFRSGPADQYDFIRWSTTGTGGASGDRLDIAGYSGVNLGYTSPGSGGTLVNTLTVNGASVGIGTTSPAQTFDVVGKVQLYAGYNGDPTINMTNSGWNRIVASTSGSSLAFFTNGNGVSNNTPQMLLNSSGYLGINTSNPLYPLDVELTTCYANNCGTQATYNYVNSTAGHGTVSNGYTGNIISLYLSGRLFQASGEIDFASDRRIKDVIGISNSADDLARLMKIEVTDYRYKDVIANGSTPKKAFIAQQIESVYPEAVKQNTEFIPDVYALDTAFQYSPDHGTCTVYLDKVHGLAVGDTIRINSDNGKIETTVTDVNSPTTITVKWQNAKPTYVFVYGRKVHDFRSVDYDRIYSLNVSATQELAKQLRETQDKLAQEQNKNKTLENRLNTTQSDIDHLKASVENLQQIIESKAQK